MNFLKILLFTVLAFALSACVYVPVVKQNEATPDTCKTFTQSMSLDAVELQVNVNMSHGCRNDECAALLASAAVVTAGSAIISGSIVLVGNSLHWLEYQGTCSDGYLNKTKQFFLDSISKSNPVN
jgi:hypothetical protein